MSTERSLRDKRSDPSPRANAPPRAVADLGRNGQDADASGNRVSTLSAPRRRKRRKEAGTEASLNNPPAVRRRTALLRGRQLRLPWRTASGSRQPSGAQCRRRERECGELPPPLWSRLVERLAGTFAFGVRWQSAVTTPLWARVLEDTAGDFADELRKREAMVFGMGVVVAVSRAVWRFASHRTPKCRRAILRLVGIREIRVEPPPIKCRRVRESHCRSESPLAAD